MSVLSRGRRQLSAGLLASVCLLLVATATSTATSAIAGTSRVGAITGTASDDGDQEELLLVLDSSGSIKEPDSSGSTKIAAAKRALHAVTAKLPDDARVGMRVYGATVFSKSVRARVPTRNSSCRLGPSTSRRCGGRSTNTSRTVRRPVDPEMAGGTFTAAERLLVRARRVVAP